MTGACTGVEKGMLFANSVRCAKRSSDWDLKSQYRIVLESSILGRVPWEGQLFADATSIISRLTRLLPAHCQHLRDVNLHLLVEVVHHPYEC